MLERRQIQRVVLMALDEDAPFGDITSQTLVPADATAHAQLVAREPGVFAGSDVYVIAMSTIDPTVSIDMHVVDGAAFETGTVLADVSGPARAVLQAERVALNLVQRMCGIATLTAAYVAAVGDHPVRVVDTRKTTPGLRALERHAVRCGGGHNHRYSLSDAVMAKDNHLAVVGDITTALRRAALDLPHTTHIEVEVDRLEQIDAVLKSEAADTIMLDNFSLEDLRAGVKQIGGRAMVEASGGITLETIGDVAATGVDVISVGALTHSVRALDLGLDITMQSAG
ncbi:MAG: carboxylating nicotinate-nucleotide diphosphorylase [Aeromicrobium sp.]|uniref:carboxylating nicotinate-nucleotide diphosphorylase n=1 Tax=Aeromicrobium sp. TaxID=1871063 RepID=UPI003C6055C8